MTMHDMKIELASTTETERRTREIQLLMNDIEPDPEYQAMLIRDEASALDVSGHPSSELARRLEFYLGHPLPVALSTPLWKLVDAIGATRPNWPDDEPPSVQ